MTDAELDASFADLGGLAPSPQLSARTLEAVRRERAAGGWRVRILAGVGMAAMAALSLLVVTPPERGDPATMVERGSGESAVAVDLRVAVRRPTGELARFAANERYAAGDTLMFRIHTSTATSLTLRRDDVVLWEGTAPGGAFDVPVGYTLEAGEGPAVFTLSGGAELQRVFVPAVMP